MQHVFTLFNVTNVAFVIENGMTITDSLVKKLDAIQQICG